MEPIETVRAFYDANVEAEWNRIADQPEFLLTARFLDRYVKKGDRVLDIGGGPGRYSLYLAEKGCEVTLFDLSEENVRFAAREAAVRGLTLRTVCGDAREADRLVAEGGFDCVLLMGPLYHLLEEADREAAVRAACRLLKPGGVLFAAFISMYGGMIYMTREAPEIVLSDHPAEIEFRKALLAGESFAGDAFTKAFFIQPREILPFMARFPLEKLHLFGQEGIMAPNTDKISASAPEVVRALTDVSETLCEREELLSWAEHLMYVGRKKCEKGEETEKC
ncbi:MAG: class I SAM-dependent methyltransferase [Eubacteriales bacterium]|nr:class I SAM-dependent methyltransferase [Eubacteriales bacterium]